jgi:hypothetical protein
MPGLSPSKTGVNALMLPGIHDFTALMQDVDGRAKPGHDFFCYFPAAIAFRHASQSFAGVAGMSM